MNWNHYTSLAPETQTAVLNTLAQQAGSNWAQFQSLLNMLAYHGETAVLTQLLSHNWPTLQNDPQLSDWQKQTLATFACDVLIFHHLQTSQEPTPDLQKQLQQFYPIDEQQLARYLTALTSQSEHEWKLIHFHIDNPTPETNQQASQNLAVLMVDFLAYASQVHHIAYAKANMMRQQLPTYFVERRTGQLEPRQDFAAAMRGERPRPIIRPKPHPLCPDSVTLEQYMAKLLNYQPQPTIAAALFGLIPTWLQFLQAQKLIDVSYHNQTITDCQQMAPDLLQYFQTHIADDILLNHIQNWPKP